ncbi:L,D-transpeptidase family protein [Sphingomonas piscis]|uniref:L,D-transpeptidase family protein n=1 Tax=Sphingomonas piscis TaxID=2714943 RepID=A0A6G7YQ66_9SPHN|nr:L,D-transpeptidase family protein [Sphingomonas piscis]QIK78876.1 L,D-transpeptidase family protein [Sphingomonas piscis]
MTARFTSLAILSVMTSSAALAIQTPAPVPIAPAQPQASSPQDPLAPAPIQLPPPMWQAGDAQQLLDYIGRVAGEGLNPINYDPAGLAAAIRSQDPVAISAAANDRFNRLSSDLALGYVPRKERKDWYVKDPDLSSEQRDALLRSALAQHRVAEALDGLLPTHPQYGALKNALKLAGAGDVAKANRIKLNMERWRWLPRELGDKYIIVNVPGFYATLVENGQNRWKQRAIAGATKTPTPQLSVMATGVVANPSWEVPPSITREVAGKPGYVPVKKDGKIIRWSQPPGPSNALGQLKFVMYNPHNIYLHDTNARSRFSSRMRALSHGCIRTENILDLASELLADDGGEWTPDKFQEVLAAKKTKQLNFVKPLPVYIVYFSVAALNDGRIVDYSDMYARDGKVLASLQAPRGLAPKTQVAAR